MEGNQQQKPPQNESQEAKNRVMHITMRKIMQIARLFYALF